MPAFFMRLFSVLILFIGLFNSEIATAQSRLRWQLVNDSFQYLPPSIRVFKTNDSLNGRPFKAFYAEINLKDPNLAVSAEVGRGSAYKLSEYYEKEEKPYIIINGGYFNRETLQNLSMVMQKGVQLAFNQPSVKSKMTDSFYYPTRAALGFSRSKRPFISWVFTDTVNRYPMSFEVKPIKAKGINADPSFEDLETLEHWQWWRMETAIGGGPVLVQKGKVFITANEEQLFVNSVKELHPRTAAGYTRNGKLILLVVEGRNKEATGASLEELAQLFVELKCKEAINLDGGGSSAMLINGKHSIHPSDKEGERPVPSVLMIKAVAVAQIY